MSVVLTHGVGGVHIVKNVVYQVLRFTLRASGEERIAFPFDRVHQRLDGGLYVVGNILL